MSKMKINETMDAFKADGFAYAEKQLVKDFGYNPSRSMKGDILIELTERGQKPLKIKMKNIITLQASVLVARLFKDKSEPTNGMFALALGTGNPIWDPFNPPAASNTQTQLEAEIIRKVFSTKNFITTLGAVSATPTNIVDFTTFFTESEAIAALLEMGLVGGDATLAPNTGTLVNFRTFPVINKSSTSTLSITWRITF